MADITPYRRPSRRIRRRSRGSAPAATRCALVVDDTTETVHDVRVRPRETPDGGATPRAVSAPAARTKPLEKW